MAAEPVTAAQRRLSRASVPEGWKVVHLGDVFEQVVDTGHSVDLPVLSVTVSGEVVRRSSLDRKSDREVPREKYLRVRPGDIAYNTMRMWQGASGLVKEEGYISPAYMVCRPKAGESSEFWTACFHYEPMIRSFLDHSQGFAKDRYRLYFHHFATVPALRPPLGEQRKIAAILDSVDDAIGKTKTVAQLLSTVKKQLSQDIFARGFPGRHAAIRTTEVGQMTAGWDLIPLQELIRSGPSNGRSPKAATKKGGIPTFSIAAVRNGSVSVSDNLKFADALPSEVAAFMVQKGDILIVRGNASPDLLGRCGIIESAQMAAYFRIYSCESGRMPESRPPSSWKPGIPTSFITSSCSRRRQPTEPTRSIKRMSHQHWFPFHLSLSREKSQISCLPSLTISRHK